MLVGDGRHPFAGEQKVARVVTLQGDSVEEREHPVHAGVEDALETALANHEDTFMVTDDDTTEHSKCLL